MNPAGTAPPAGPTGAGVERPVPDPLDVALDVGPAEDVPAADPEAAGPVGPDPEPDPEADGDPVPADEDFGVEPAEHAVKPTKTSPTKIALALILGKRSGRNPSGRTPSMSTKTSSVTLLTQSGCDCVALQRRSWPRPALGDGGHRGHHPKYVILV